MSENEADRHSEEHNNAGNRSIITIDRAIEIMLIGVLATAAVVQLRLYNIQTGFMKAQTSISTAQTYISAEQTKLVSIQTRPWIKADLVIDGDFFFQEVVGYYAPFHLNLTNIGHSPAFDVRTGVAPYVPQKKGEDMLAVWRERCEANRKISDTVPHFGTVLFPDEQGRIDRDTPARMGIIGVEQVDNGLKSSEVTDRFDLRLMGCISYTDANGTVYQTGVNYSVWTRNPNGAWNVGINPYERIPANEIVPIMFHIAAGMTY